MKLKDLLRFIKENDIPENVDIVLPSASGDGSYSPCSEIYMSYYRPYNECKGGITIGSEQNNSLILFPIA